MKQGKRKRGRETVKSLGIETCRLPLIDICNHILKPMESSTSSHLQQGLYIELGYVQRLYF